MAGDRPGRGRADRRRRRRPPPATLGDAGRPGLRRASPSAGSAPASSRPRTGLAEMRQAAGRGPAPPATCRAWSAPSSTSPTRCSSSGEYDESAEAAARRPGRRGPGRGRPHHRGVPAGQPRRGADRAGPLGRGRRALRRGGPARPARHAGPAVAAAARRAAAGPRPRRRRRPGRPGRWPSSAGPTWHPQLRLPLRELRVAAALAAGDPADAAGPRARAAWPTRRLATEPALRLAAAAVAAVGRVAAVRPCRPPRWAPCASG